MTNKANIPKLLLISLLYLLSFSYILSYFEIAYNYSMLSYLKWMMLILNTAFLLLLVGKKTEPLAKMNSLNLSVGAFILMFLILNIFLSLNGTTSLATSGIIVLSFIFFKLLSKTVSQGILSVVEINQIIYTSIFFMVLISAFLSIHEYLTFMDVLTGSGRYRIKGLFRHPNTLAMNCVLGSFALFDNIIKSLFEKKKHFFQYVILAFFIFNIVVSDSNTAKYTLIVFVILYFYIYMLEYKVNSLRAFHLYLIIILLTAGICYLLYYLSTTNLEDRANSVSVRLNSWITVFNYITSEPIHLLFGYGLSGTGGYSTGSFQQLELAVDNGYVTFLYQAGLSGLVVIAFYFFSVLLKIIFKPDLKSERHLKAIVFACGFSLLLYSVFENLLIAMGNFITLYVWFRIFNFKYEVRTHTKI